VPVKWSELAKLAAANPWNIFNVHERLANLRGDPWKACSTTRQTLEKSAKLL